VNLALLRELDAAARAAGARFAVVDLEPWLGRREATPASLSLADLCAREGFGYVPLGLRLGEASRAGRYPIWRYDPHLNEVGNEVFAAALHEWLASE
jgi:hypothetical protein